MIQDIKFQNKRKLDIKSKLKKMKKKQHSFNAFNIFYNTNPFLYFDEKT